MDCHIARVGDTAYLFFVYGWPGMSKELLLDVIPGKTQHTERIGHVPATAALWRLQAEVDPYGDFDEFDEYDNGVILELVVTQ